MGKLHYGAQSFDLDDRLLSHLQREPDFNFAWAEQLADSASKSGGLIIMAEDLPAEPESERGRPRPQTGDSP